MTSYLHLFWFCIHVLQLCSPAGVASCKIEDHLSSSTYVTASFEKSVPVTGCTSRKLSHNSQPVYVVGLNNWNSSGDQMLVVDLHLQNTASHDDSEKPIFVLASEQPVIWRLHFDVRHRVFNGKFVVSNQSQLSYSYRLKYKVRHLAFPFDGDWLRLSTWVRQKWGSMTAFAYLSQPANWIMLPLSSVPEGNATCDIQPNFLKIQASINKEQTVRGCVERMKEKSFERDVHVIELSSASFDLQGHPLPVAELNIKSKVKKQLVIVLKCHHSVKWKIFTSLLKGSVDFIADQPIDSSGIKARHFHVAAERMRKLTGQDLIAWSAEKYGSVTSYSLVAVANRIELTIDIESRLFGKASYSTVSPPTETTVLGTSDPRLSVADEKKRLKRLLIRSLSLSCKENSMRISIWKYPFRNFPLSFDNISFLDLSCQAVDAGSQLVLSTRYSDCGTLHPVTRDGTSIFTNAVVVRPEISALSVSQDVKPKMLADMKMPVVINVSCHYLKPKKDDKFIQQSTVQFEMNIYKDKNYNELVEFPALIYPSERLFVEIKISGHEDLNIVLGNCSLETDGKHSEERWLIVNGCMVNETWKWIDSGSRSSGQNERFAFGFSDSLGVNTAVNLTCSISVCAQHPDHNIPGLNMCPSDLKGCDFKSHSSSSSQVVARLNKGPFILSPAEDEDMYPDVDAEGPLLPFSPVSVRKGAEYPVGMERVHSECTGMVLVDGVTTEAVIGISFAAFFIGVLLMSSLWYIHVRTGPRKKIGLKATDSKSVKSKFFCSDGRA